MNVAMVVTWAHPVVGREMKALEYGAEVQGFWRKQAADGKCTEPELFFGSTGTGLWMVKGDQADLNEIWMSPESQRLLAKGALLLGGLGWQSMITGDAADDYLGVYGQVAGELGVS